MKTEIMIAVLALLCIGSLAAVFILWSKLDEQKQKTKGEHANYLAALDLHNTTAERAQLLDNEREVIYGQLNKLSNINFGLLFDNAKLQDRLSALLCPMNDHVWKDGVCVKCGRMQDA